MDWTVVALVSAGAALWVVLFVVRFFTAWGRKQGALHEKNAPRGVDLVNKELEVHPLSMTYADEYLYRKHDS